MSHEKKPDAGKLAALDAGTRLQRERVMQLAMLTRDRLRPANIAREAGNRALDIGLDSMDKAKAMARAHPVRTAGLVAALGAVAARKPLFGLMRAGYARLRDTWADNRQDDDAAPSADEDEAGGAED